MRSRYTTFFGELFNFFQVTVGVLIGAAAVNFFLLPSNIAPTGVTGVSVLLNALIGTPVGLVIFILNLPILALGYRYLNGIRVVFLTSYVILVYSIALDLVPQLVLAEDRLLNAIFGAVLSGISGALILRSGGTGGGTATIARIIQWRTGVPMNTTYLLTDSLVVAGAGFIFSWESAMFSLLTLFVSGLALDYFLEGPSIIRSAVIITDKPQEVADALMETLKRGITSWDAQGMYQGKHHKILYITIRRSQVNDLRRILSQVDPNAFVVINQGHAAYGEGFQHIAPRSKS